MTADAIARQHRAALIRGYADRVVREVFQIDPRDDGHLYDGAVQSAEMQLALVWHEGMTWEQITERFSAEDVARWQGIKREREAARRLTCLRASDLDCGARLALFLD